MFRKLKTAFHVLIVVSIVLVIFIVGQMKPKIFAAVVPHHDMVAEQRANLLEKISFDYEPETIILISPDHFLKSRKSLTTTDRIWEIKNGSQKIMPDQRIINRIVKDLNFVDNRSDVFDGEHGIKNILGDIGKFFPNAKIVPIIVGGMASRLDIVKLVDEFDLICKKRCAVIASVDMSHYLPARLAEIHDIKTVRAISDGDEDRVLESEVDSPESLFFLSLFAEQNNLESFRTFANTNSGFLVGNFVDGVTTHILGNYVKKEEKRENNFRQTFTFLSGEYDWNLLSKKGFDHKRFGEIFARAISGTDSSWSLAKGYDINNIYAEDDIDVVVKNLLFQKRVDSFKAVILSWQFPCNSKHSEYQEKVVRAISAAGANLVIGNCGNILQDSQIIRNKNGINTLALYSLGKIEVDNVTLRAQSGILLSGMASADELELRIFNVSINNNVFSFTSDKAGQEKIMAICENIQDFCDLDKGVIKIPI